MVAEALVFGVPVITSYGTHWEELNQHQAGWWIPIGVNPLKEALENALRLSSTERKSMGLAGRKLIAEKYSIKVVAFRMIELYEWVLGKAKRPGFINEFNKN